MQDKTELLDSKSSFKLPLEEILDTTPIDFEAYNSSALPSQLDVELTAAHLPLNLNKEMSALFASTQNATLNYSPSPVDLDSEKASVQSPKFEAASDSKEKDLSRKMSRKEADQLSSEEKQLRRKMLNRIYQQTTRAKKQAVFEQLADELAELKKTLNAEPQSLSANYKTDTLDSAIPGGRSSSGLEQSTDVTAHASKKSRTFPQALHLGFYRPCPSTTVPNIEQPHLLESASVKTMQILEEENRKLRLENEILRAKLKEYSASTQLSGTPFSS